jgi:hypothetical protein
MAWYKYYSINPYCAGWYLDVNPVVHSVYCVAGRPLTGRQYLARSSGATQACQAHTHKIPQYIWLGWKDCLGHGVSTDLRNYVVVTNSSESSRLSRNNSTRFTCTLPHFLNPNLKRPEQKEPSKLECWLQKNCWSFKKIAWPPSGNLNSFKPTFSPKKCLGHNFYFH